jgi:CRISPR-associated protein Cas1
MPCAVLEPYLQHSRQHEITRRQLALTVSAKKQLWKQIVSAKINNQSICLELNGHANTARELSFMAKQVRSGDTGHVEGYAAARYFPILFGDSFTRGDDTDMRNAWLNYGYAIVRGCVARTLTVYGLVPLFGIQHHSSLNQFNLADDFIEPYRPLVDLLVAQEATNKSELSPEAKRLLLNLVNYDIKIGGKKYSLTYAIEKTVQSFSSICMGNGKKILLPEVTFLRQHTYE